MGEKRRDNKGRVLRVGEQQRADGRYLYTCKDNRGEKQFLYSWKLEPTDKTPQGKKDSLSLREMEKEIQKKAYEATAYQNGDITVKELVKRYISTKNGVRHNTAAGYKTVMNILEKEEFGKKKIGDVKVSDAKLWLVKLQSEDGKSYSSIHNIRGVVRPAFQMAVDDDLISKNPFNWQLATVLINDSIKREAVTPRQERTFLDFVKNDKYYSKYYDGMYILFKTGMRISEFCGLTMEDVDMQNKRIRIDHQLQRMRNGTYIIEDTKTTYGERVLPMNQDIYDCFKRIIANRKKPQREPEVDGRKGFLVLDKNNMPCLANHWEKRFQYALGKYNRIYKEQLPMITPHICRHTFCTNMAKSGVSPKTLQYLMGHSDIATTLGVYTHLKFEDAEKELKEREKESKKLE